MRRAALLLLGVAACSGAPSEEEIAAARTRAEEASGRLMKALMGELMQALAKGPPETALEVCADRAQDLTAGIEKETGVKVRRTALKLRNPANAPDAYERAWLERAAATHGRGETIESTAEVVDGELRYLRPILLAPLCTQCHGPSVALSDGVRSVLAERYPEDDATGFGPLDLRGAVSVRVPLEE